MAAADVRDEGESIDTPIYAHVSGDGRVHCSFGVDFQTVDGLKSPGSYTSTVEWVEGQFFNRAWADDVIGQVVPEPVRDAADLDPTRVGTLTYDLARERVLAVEFSPPEDVPSPEVVADGGTQGAVDHDYDEAARSAQDTVYDDLANMGAPLHSDMTAGDIAFDLVTRQPLVVLDVTADDLVSYYEDEEFNLATYKQHAWLPVTPEDRVYECAFIGGIEDLHSFSNTYDYPAGRLARVPIELAGGDE